MKLNVTNKSDHPLPLYHTPGSAAFDLTANLNTPVTINPFERVLVPTGLFIAIPLGYEAQIRPRSGLALKHGVTMANAPGTIDSDYRDEWRVILINLGDKAYTVQNGERIAQVVIAKHEVAQWVEVQKLDATQRKGGFGSTGK